MIGYEIDNHGKPCIVRPLYQRLELIQPVIRIISKIRINIPVVFNRVGRTRIPFHPGFAGGMTYDTRIPDMGNAQGLEI